MARNDDGDRPAAHVSSVVLLGPTMAGKTSLLAAQIPAIARGRHGYPAGMNLRLVPMSADGRPSSDSYLHRLGDAPVATDTLSIYEYHLGLGYVDGSRLNDVVIRIVDAAGELAFRRDRTFGIPEEATEKLDEELQRCQGIVFGLSADELEDEHNSQTTPHLFWLLERISHLVKPPPRIAVALTKCDHALSFGPDGNAVPTPRETMEFIQYSLGRANWLDHIRSLSRAGGGALDVGFVATSALHLFSVAEPLVFAATGLTNKYVFRAETLTDGSPLHGQSESSHVWPDEDNKPPPIPGKRPAGLAPQWRGDTLDLPNVPISNAGGSVDFVAALRGLRRLLGNFADEISREANIDRRFLAFVRGLSAQIPEDAPLQHELFEIGHVEAVFAGYAKTVDQEWPDFLASRYHAVALQFDRTLRQVPVWREFKLNAASETLSAEQVADSTSLAREAASALRQDEAASFVNPAIPQALEQLADLLPFVKAGEEPPPDAIEAGKALLAAALVESVNNTLKPIAEVALSAARDYAKGAGKGFKKAAKKQGPIDGEKAFKWLRRLAIAGAAGTGSFVALSNLITKFPEAFGWLERVLHVLK